MLAQPAEAKVASPLHATMLLLPHEPTKMERSVSKPQAVRVNSAPARTLAKRSQYTSPSPVKYVPWHSLRV